MVAHAISETISGTRAPALENLNLNFVEGVAGTQTLDLLQHFLRKDAVHQAFLQRKKEGADARQRLEDAVKNTRLTGGLMFKVRHTRCDDEVLAIRRDMEKKKEVASAGAIMKAVEKYNAKLKKCEALIAKDKDFSKYNASELKTWCNVRRRKEDGALPSLAKEVKSFASGMAGREPLSLKEHLMELGYVELLVDSILENPEDALAEAGDDGDEDQDQDEDDGGGDGDDAEREPSP